MIRIQKLRLYSLSRTGALIQSILFLIIAYAAICVFTYHKNPFLLKTLLPLFILPVVVFLYVLNKTNRKKELLLLERGNIEETVNTLNNRISHSENLNSALNKKIERYSYLEELTKNLSLKLSLEEVSRVLISAISGIFRDVEANFMLYLLDQERQSLSLVLSKMADRGEIIKEKKGDIFDYWVLKKMQSLLVENIRTDFRFDLDSLDTQRAKQIGSLAVVPIVAQSRPIGLLRLDSRQTNSFLSEDLRLLSTISDLAAVAIQNALFYQRTRELAIKDGLTGLYLRRFLLERLHDELERARFTNSFVSLLMLDIDNFKKYNDKFGHTAGDLVLESIARILGAIAGEAGNVISRFGGEEFIILVSDCPKPEAVRLAKNIASAIRNKDIVLRRKKTKVTVSIGVATFPVDSRSQEDLINRVDSRMYRAKQSGRDKVCSC